MRLQGFGLWALLLLAGCGYDSPPRDYRPANGDCGPLVGHWVVDEADLRWIAPDLVLPAGQRFPFLSITRDAQGTLDLVLHRRSTDVLSEALSLRLTRPDDYRAWRAWVLGEPPDPELAEIHGPSVGPVLTRQWPLSLSRCDDGWRNGSRGHPVTPRPGSAEVEHLGFLAMALGEHGELLLQQHVRRENTGGSFFGQPLRWYTYAYSNWHRLQPLPAAMIPGPLTPADLPAVPDRSTRMALELGRRQSWSRFEAWVRDGLPPGVTVTILRPRQMDPVAMALPPDQLRVELAAHWPPGTPDPVTPLLARHDAVGPIEVKRSHVRHDNRPYLLVEFTIRVTPVPL